MAKIATDLYQSRLLAKILPIESADMFYGTIAPYDYSDRMYDGGVEDIPLPKSAKKSSVLGTNEYDGEVPAWSSTALMDILPQPAIDDNGREFELIISKEDNDCYSLLYKDTWTNQFVDDLESDGDELVDACVDMIKLLKERKLL